MGSIIGKGASAGKLIKAEFFKQIPALSKLINKVRKFAEARGYLPAIDGRKIFIREYEGRLLIHTALNALLQASGSIVVKRWMVIANEKVKEEKLDAKQIIFYHDELAFDCAEKHKDRLKEILQESMILAGEYYSLRIPLHADVKFGVDWSIH